MPKAVTSSGVAAATRLRQSAYRKQAAAQIQDDRSARLATLVARERAIENAVDSYVGLHGTVTTIRSSSLFIPEARELPAHLGGPPLEPGFPAARWRSWELASRQPIGFLAGHRGNALNIYLAMLFTLQAEPEWLARVRTASPRYVGDRTWARLCGQDTGNARARREIMSRALTVLDQKQLIKLKMRGSGHSIEGFEFLREDGSGSPYTKPAPTENVLSLPGAFFANGWAHALTSSEIGLLLLVMDVTNRFGYDQNISHDEGVEITQHLRHRHYGISSEVYHCLHTLSEFGLLSVVDPMVGLRVQGKFSDQALDQPDASGRRRLALAPVPYRLRVNEAGYERAAFSVVSAALQLPAPRTLQ